MSVKSVFPVAASVAAMLIIFVMSAAEANDASVPQAPQVTCDITLRFWCIAQAGDSVNMTDADGYRTWSIAPARSARVSVIVREDKRCNSPNTFKWRRIEESDVVQGALPAARNHVVTVSLTADGVCVLRVQYPVGDDDWARTGQRIAKYWLFVCDGDSCQKSLLSPE